MSPRAYYNEHDKHAAQWLRNLIAIGEIAPGEVDERSILDVAPDDLRGFTQVHWFAGIGGWSHALRLAGWADSRAIWTGSCPCQPFSAAGKGGGFDDERHLWPAWYWLIQQCRPDRIAGEQVEGPLGRAWLDLVSTDLENAGYAFGAVVFPSASVGAPHGRHRTYWMADAGGAGSGRDAGAILGAQTEGRRGRSEIGRVSDELKPCDNALRLADTQGQRRRVGLREVLRAPSADAGAVPGQRDGDALRGRGAACLVADAAGRVSRDGDIQRCREHGLQPEGHGTRNVALADQGQRGRRTINGERQRDGQDGGRPQDHGGAPRRRSIGLVADTGAPGLPLREPAELRGPRRRIEGRAVEQRSGSPFGEYGRPGPTNGFWRDADWLFCRDGKWRPVEARILCLVDGIPARVGELRPDLQAKTEALLDEAAQRLQTEAGEILREVRNAVGSEDIFGARGRIRYVHEAQILLSYLFEYAREERSEPDGEDGSGTGRGSQRELRVLWRSVPAGDPSRQRGLDRRPLRELTDTLRLLSSTVARVASESRYPMLYADAPASFPLANSRRSDRTENTLGRLRSASRAKMLAGYGNAINAHQAAYFIRAAMLS